MNINKKIIKLEIELEKYLLELNEFNENYKTDISIGMITHPLLKNSFNNINRKINYTKERLENLQQRKQYEC